MLEAEVGPDSPVAGRLIRDVNAGSDLRVLALDGRWRPRDDLAIDPGATVAVVGTPDGCDAVLRQAT